MPKFEENHSRLFGWVGRILWVDLTARRVEIRDTREYVPEFIGGRGIAAKVAWDTLRPGTKAFDPGNPLMFFTGPLAGTTAPCSGRTVVCGVSPQAYPVEWYTRSGMGGHWGPELKYAGYDGVVVVGVSESPVYVWVEDGGVEIRDASHLWGKGIYETQEVLMGELGGDVRIVTIGPSGERRSRIGVISTETESSAGQGGFGGVMGSKGLKAIVVRGTGEVRIAYPEDFLRKCRAIAKQLKPQGALLDIVRLNPERVRRFGEQCQACTQQCSVGCAKYYTRVPGVIHKNEVYSGQFHCIAPLFAGVPKNPCYSWHLSFEASFEVCKMANDYGLNHWDLVFGIFPWLQRCKEAGVLTEIEGLEIDLNDPHFWAEMLRKIAYREGIGDVLAEGGVRAAGLLGVGQEYLPQMYTAWGSAGHWDGHGDHANLIVFPYWLVTALQWAVDTRDPISSAHGYCSNMMHLSPMFWDESPLTWERIKEMGRRVYGSARAVDPTSGYEDKEIPAVWHGHRSVLKDSLPLDDWMFPQFFSMDTEGHTARVGEMEGPSFEYHLYVSATGVERSEEEVEQDCERAFNIERAECVRDYGRRREEDETVISSFEGEENWTNPLIGEKRGMDRKRFRELLDRYYVRRGWDVETGVPTRAKLEELELGYVADELHGDTVTGRR